MLFKLCEIYGHVCGDEDEGRDKKKKKRLQSHQGRSSNHLVIWSTCLRRFFLLVILRPLLVFLSLVIPVHFSYFKGNKEIQKKSKRNWNARWCFMTCILNSGYLAGDMCLSKCPYRTSKQCLRRIEYCSGIVCNPSMITRYTYSSSEGSGARLLTCFNKKLHWLFTCVWHLPPNNVEPIGLSKWIDVTGNFIICNTVCGSFQPFSLPLPSFNNTHGRPETTFIHSVSSEHASDTLEYFLYDLSINVVFQLRTIIKLRIVALLSTPGCLLSHHIPWPSNYHYPSRWDGRNYNRKVE